MSDIIIYVYIMLAFLLGFAREIKELILQISRGLLL